MNLKPRVLESMKYGTNDWIFSALDSAEKKSSLLVILLISNLFFFQSLFPFTNGYQSHLLLDCNISHWKHCCWLKSLWVDQIPSLLTAPEWPLPTPPPIYLFGQSNTSLRGSCCSRLHSPSLLLTSGKATEESWAEGGFCMLVKKNNLCQRKVLQQLCCKTCTFQG